MNSLVAANKETLLLPPEPDQKELLPSLGSDIPVHVIARIFYFAYSKECDLFTLSKSWARLRNDCEFYKELYSNISPHIFNSERILNAWGDPGEEPRLPYPWLVEFNPERGALTLVPEKIKRPDKTIEYLRLKNLKKWSENPAKGHSFKFTEDSRKSVYDENDYIWNTHWVWIRRQAAVRENQNNDLETSSNVFEKGGGTAFMHDILFSIMGKYNITGTSFFKGCTNEKETDLSIWCNRIKRIDVKKEGLTFVNDCRGDFTFLAAKRTFGIDKNFRRIPGSGSKFPEFFSMTLEELKATLKQTRSEWNEAMKIYSVGEIAFLIEEKKVKMHTLQQILAAKMPDLGSKIEETKRKLANANDIHLHVDIEYTRSECERLNEKLFKLELELEN